MVIRVCSILGTLLLVLWASNPALAEKDDRKGRAKPSDGQAAAKDTDETEAGGVDAEEEEFVEPDPWERPPPDEEKPPVKELAQPDPAPKVSGGKPIQVALLAGWTFMTDRRAGVFPTDPYRLGFGVRGGYIFDEYRLYTGAYYLYYLGSSETGEGTANRAAVGNVESSANYMHFGLEAGYDVLVGPATLRPSIQIGMALGIYEHPNLGTTSNGDLAFNPGVMFHYPMDDLFLGGDFRAQFVTADGVSGVGLFATAGMRFE